MRGSLCTAADLGRRDPLGPQEGALRVVRGRGAGAPPARCAQRSGVAPQITARDLGVRLVVPLGYGLGRYGSVPVTFRLVDPEAKKGDAAITGGYDLRVIRMQDRLAARTAGTETVWQRVQDPGSPATLTMVPGKYYVYAERMRRGKLARGVEIKFQVWEKAIEISVPVPERDLGRYGSGGAEKPQ